MLFSSMTTVAIIRPKIRFCLIHGAFIRHRQQTFSLCTLSTFNVSLFKQLIVIIYFGVSFTSSVIKSTRHFTLHPKIIFYHTSVLESNSVPNGTYFTPTWKHCTDGKNNYTISTTVGDLLYFIEIEIKYLDFTFADWNVSNQDASNFGIRIRMFYSPFHIPWTAPNSTLK